MVKITMIKLLVMIVGFFLVKFHLIDYLRSYKVIGWSTILFAFLLYVSDLRKVKKTINTDFKLSTAVYIGLFQVLSLIPGVSRSGITITGSRFFNFSKVESAKISFLLSIPIPRSACSYSFPTIDSLLVHVYAIFILCSFS